MGSKVIFGDVTGSSQSSRSPLSATKMGIEEGEGNYTSTLMSSLDSFENEFGLTPPLKFYSDIPHSPNTSFIPKEDETCLFGSIQVEAVNEKSLSELEISDSICSIEPPTKKQRLSTDSCGARNIHENQPGDQIVGKPLQPKGIIDSFRFIG